MKVFIDTNILVELFENRKEADNIDHIFEYIEQQGWERFLSVGSFYTLTYLTERILRRQGLVNPECSIRLRSILSQILYTFSIADASKEELRNGLSNPAFKDLEDSYQFETAQAANCQVLLTINIRDFPKASTAAIEILTPSDFITKYIR